MKKFLEAFIEAQKELESSTILFRVDYPLIKNNPLYNVFRFVISDLSSNKLTRSKAIKPSYQEEEIVETLKDAIIEHKKI